MLIRFVGLRHLQCYRGHVHGGRPILAGEVVDLPDDEAAYLLTDFPGAFELVEAKPAAKKAVVTKPSKHTAAE